MESKKSKIVSNISTIILSCLLIGAFIWWMASGTMLETGPFRVTMYSGGQPIRSWIVDSRPDLNGAIGYLVKTNDGKKIQISGNIVIEKEKP